MRRIAQPGFAFDRLSFSLRKLEAPVVPRDGAEFDSNFQWHDSWLGASDHFPSAESHLALFKSVNKAGSLYVKGSGGSILGFTNNGLPVFSLGGPQPLAAYGENEFLTNQYFYGSAGYVHRVYRLPSLLGGNIYLTGAYEVGKPYGMPGLHDCRWTALPVSSWTTPSAPSFWAELPAKAGIESFSSTWGDGSRPRFRRRERARNSYRGFAQMNADRGIQ